MKKPRVSTRRAAPKKLQEARAIPPRELYEALVLAAPEISEAFSPAEFELALDDRGWTGYGGLTGLSQIFGGDLTPQARKIVIEKCRLSWLTDPLAKQAVRVWTTYCLGNGLSYEAEDSRIQDELDAFFETPLNERFLNPAGQQSLSNQLLVDGDIFFSVTYADPVPLLRTFDPIQIERIITDPNDDSRVLCYRRVTAPSETLYYADWTLGADVSDAEITDPDTRQQITIQRDNKGQVIPVYHLAFDRFGQRGHSLLSCSLSWSREHARFMVARVAICQALAKFATKITAKGGQAALDAVAKRIQSSHVAGGYGTFEKNPSPAPGSTWLQNQGMDMQATPRATGAGDATGDSNNLIRMVCAGTGVFFHYLTGDPSTGNLATATSMELPMMKEFLSYQELWRGAWKRLLSIVRKEDPAKKPQAITIEMPPILDEDLAKLGSFLTPLTTAFPESKIPEVLRPFLIALGVENIDDVMDAIEEQRKQIDQQNAANAKAAHDNAMALATVKTSAPAAPASGAPAPPQMSLNKESIDALEHFANSLKEVMAT